MKNSIILLIPPYPLGILFKPDRFIPSQNNLRNNGLLNSGLSKGTLGCSIPYCEKKKLDALYSILSKPQCLSLVILFFEMNSLGVISSSYEDLMLKTKPIHGYLENVLTNPLICSGQKYLPFPSLMASIKNRVLSPWDSAFSFRASKNCCSLQSNLNWLCRICVHGESSDVKCWPNRKIQALLVFIKFLAISASRCDFPIPAGPVRITIGVFAKSKNALFKKS